MRSMLGATLSGVKHRRAPVPGSAVLCAPERSSPRTARAAVDRGGGLTAFRRRKIVRNEVPLLVEIALSRTESHIACIRFALVARTTLDKSAKRKYIR